MSRTVLSTALTLSLALALAFTLTGCATSEQPADAESLPAEAEPLPADGSAGGPTEGSPPLPAGGSLDDASQLAPGLYESPDGTVRVVGTLEWIDLEGGFWAVVGGTAAEGTEGKTVAVIANGGELNDTLAPLAGRQVSILGERFDGASIRMAGPEIVAETIEEMNAAPGPAE